MEKLERENKRLQILIIILMALLIAFGGNYFYENVIVANKNNGNTNKEDINNIITSKVETEKNAMDWMDYLLNQDIININIERHIYTGDGDSYEKINKDINIEQLRNIFNKFKTYALTKKYYVAGGYPVGDILTISYIVNDNKYNLQISNGEVWDAGTISDDNLISSLENSNHNNLNEELINEDNVHYNFIFNGFDNSIYDDYFE